MTSPLPPLYASWMEDCLGGPIPEEREATCLDCAMLPSEGEPGEGYFFHPRTKCCTYLPELPNFLVGRVLLDEDPAAARGRATLEARLEHGKASPLGLMLPRSYQLWYQSGKERLFGRALSMRCPHYLEAEGGLCGIWRHRNAVCSTWFCKHERGLVGLRFWKALSRLLAAVERSLSRYCLLRIGLEDEALEQLFPSTGPMTAKEEPLGPADVDGEPDLELRRALFGRYFGRERDFYRECARLVAQLSWGEVLAIGGPELELFAHRARRAYQDLISEELPSPLEVGRFEISGLSAESARFTSYSPYDPLEVPRALLEVLPHFDGRPTEEVLQGLAEEGFEVEEALVRRLADFEILLPCARLGRGSHH
jgi:hypothetical protein